jgi:hypothetical protein
MKPTNLLSILAALGILASTLVATSASPPVSPPVFSEPLEIDNPYFPFTPGGMKVFTGVSDRQKITIVDLYREETRLFDVGGVDVDTRILQETEFEQGQLVEISQNYFAQADDGTVYYLGEVVDIYEDGEVVSHEGSWLVGGPTEPGDPAETANAAGPAVFMPADPEVGDTFKPEDVFPVADETVRVLSLNRRVTVPAGRFKNVLQVRETSPLSSGHGTKWYAPGAGVVQGKSNGEWFKLIALAL